MSKLLTLSMCLMLLIALTTGARAQFSIPTNSYQPALGSMVEYADAGGVDSSLFSTVSSGAGGGHTWDFSSLSFTAPYNGTFVDPSAVPATDSFPTATHAVRYALGTDTIWNFFRSVSTEYSFLGSVAHVNGIENINNRDISTPEITFPLDYNDTWTIIKESADTSSPSVYTITYDTTTYEADAYGDAVYNSNSVPCLRVVSIQHIAQVTYLNGTPFMTTTTVNEDVQYISAGFEVLMSVGRTSINGAPFSYYGSGFGDFFNSPTDVVENDLETVPNEFMLSQNYPNPFNPTTEINFSLPTASHVKLTVFNLLGQETNVLVDQQLPAGSFTASWNGRNTSGHSVASGIYFYRLETGTYTDTKKMMLLK